MIAFFVAAATLSVLSPSGQASWLQLDVAGQLDARTLNASTPNNPPTGRWLGGNATFGLNVYGSRVVDDDAAPPLQPFLQRVARFRVEGGGGSAAIRYPVYALSSAVPSSYLALYEASDQGGRFDAQAEGYLVRWLYLAGRFDVGYARWTPVPSPQSIGGFGNVTPISSGVVLAHSDSSELRLAGAVTVGLRRRDLLLSGGWCFTAFRIGDDRLRVPFWGGAFLAGHAVVRRRVELAARVELLDGGAIAEVDATLWLRRRAGLSAGLEGGHGAFVDSTVAFDRAGGHVGFAWWFTPQLAGSLVYAPAWQHPTPVEGIGIALPDFSFVAHVITLTLTARPPVVGSGNR